MAAAAANCIFCKIIRKEIPSLKLLETEKVYAFLDIGPLSEGHALVIPKHHGEFLHDIPADSLAEILPATKQVVEALRKGTGMTDYNILQNNGKAAHQFVPHVHFHIIPRRGSDGLGVGWDIKSYDKAKMAEIHEKVLAHL
ncbi:hypothetical protein AMAG_03457 [Allomyces macrogynus ATCC 38327]|uniref:HIT domain-containing protein n=1 Tax=Allomyces macrogynus (strain ATCC 38327) TaxID=578462 RepID=A0A0L0S5X0_ALLM3|nr:Adenosine 5'-monophosphoramidase [Allomyces javanicus]KNE57943.1 hypothetical protein AMAG_04778 [Allomyces macrogynus ATCC 38327]KNE59119.1 hypothetical protein AMAG_03457 [Allomyces macrogynus ATCC 38327]|eukprot:KNE57943.1 hypothetical protein AMAG_04778 [Allomyces macrogynus ATCC 38327]